MKSVIIPIDQIKTHILEGLKLEYKRLGIDLVPKRIEWIEAGLKIYFVDDDDSTDKK